jgi:multiple sugar transport system permease protein
MHIFLTAFFHEGSAATPRAMRVWPLLATVAMLINGVTPLLWMLATSLKSSAELVGTPITYWPVHASLDNFRQVFVQQPLLSFIGNSLWVAMSSTLLTLLVASLAAYALARLQIPGRRLVMSLLIGIATFPLVTLLVPLFQTMRSLGLLNSYWALILPYTVLNLPVCTLVLISFFQSIPRNLELAAMIDGCSRLGALWHVVLPLARPGVMTAGILAFVNAWDEFLLALSMNASVPMRTLPVGIVLYQGEFTFPWPIISAALVIAMIPVVLVVMWCQERIVGGLTAGGIKG